MQKLLVHLQKHFSQFLERPNNTNVAANLSSRMTSQQWLSALAPGNPKKGEKLALTLNTHKQEPQLPLSHQDMPSHHNILSFAWLADIDAFQKENPKHTPRISENAACRLLQHALPLCYKTRNQAIFSPQDASLTLLRIVRTWASAQLFSTHPSKKNNLCSLAIESSLYDLHTLQHYAWNHHQSLPLFVCIDILILISILEHLVTCRQNTNKLTDKWLNELSLLIKRILEKKENMFFKPFLEQNQTSQCLNDLSNILNSFFQEDNGTATFSSNPAIHAHLFAWLSLIYTITEQYDTSHITIRDKLLPQLLRIINNFCNTPSEKNTSLLYPAFLSHSFPNSPFSQPFLPLSEHTLAFFVQKFHNIIEKPLKPHFQPLPQMGYEHISSDHFSLHIHHSPFSAPQHKNFPLDNIHDHHSPPSHFFLHAGRKNHKPPLFSQSSPPPEHLPFLRTSGIGIHQQNSNPILYSTEQFSHSPPQNNSIPFNNLYKKIPRTLLSHAYSKLPTPTENTQHHTSHLHFNPINLHAKREIFLTKKHPFIIGIDTFEKSRNSVHSPLLFHISFFCPHPCFVTTTQDQLTSYINQPLEKTKYLWRLQLLPSQNNTNLHWQYLHHQKGTWIFLSDFLPSENNLSIPWILNLEKNIKSLTDTQQQLSFNF